MASSTAARPTAPRSTSIPTSAYGCELHGARMAHRTRFQFDSQWQRDFLALALAILEQKEHVAAGCQLRDAGVRDEALAELRLADEIQEQIDLLLHALRHP